jgi:hypothetical protein
LKLGFWVALELKLKGRPPRGGGTWELKLKVCAGLELGP